ncbi:hypothetical protein ACRRTK_019612 [Alexandromys fortis]
MERKLRVLLGVLWVQICWVRGAEVEQSPSALSLHEGISSTLSCNFSATMTTVQWFRQNSRGSLINLFYLASGRKEHGRLKSIFDSKERYSTLHIRDAQLQDSGTYLCAAYAQCSLQACSLSANCSWVCSYSTNMRRLCGRLCTAVALSDLHQLKGVSRGEKLEQPPLLSIQEGGSALITCTYTDSANDYFYWYKQEPGAGLQFLLNILSNVDRKEEQRFTVLLNKEDKRLSLNITAAHLEDSATYICAATMSQGEQVEQRPSTLRVQEGARAVINCTYEDSVSSYFPWYKQEPGKHPKLIIDIRSNMERKQDQRLIILHDKKAKHVSLHITDTQLGDSAMYFCAARVSSQEKVQQTPEFLSVSEGATASFNCTANDRNYDYFWWYKQYPGKGPMFLMSIFSSGEKKEGRSTVHLNQESLHVSLHIRDSQLSDSAVYLCAASTQCSPVHLQPAPKPTGPQQSLS